MFEPYKKMRVYFQVRNMIVIMPHATSKCELVSDFQIKACDPKTQLKE